MPALELIQHLRAPLLLALWRAAIWRTALCARCAPAVAGMGVGARLLRGFLAAIAFELCVAFFALRDLVAALLDRIPNRAEMPASTRLAYAAVGIMAAIFLNDVIGPAPASTNAALNELPRPDWIDIARPHGMFALEAASLEAVEARYAVRRHRNGGGRRDELTFGNPAARGPYVRVSLYRPGTEGMAETDPLEAVVALARESGIDAELQETHRALRTKFGRLPIIAMTVSGAGEIRRCLATASAWQDPAFGLAAWWCNDGPELVAHGEFACLLDRIALLSAGGDDQLAEFFARAELRRAYCENHGSFVSPTPRLGTGWIDAKRSPELRKGLSAR